MPACPSRKSPWVICALPARAGPRSVEPTISAPIIGSSQGMAGRRSLVRSVVSLAANVAPISDRTLPTPLQGTELIAVGADVEKAFHPHLRHSISLSDSDNRKRSKALLGVWRESESDFRLSPRRGQKNFADGRLAGTPQSKRKSDEISIVCCPPSIRRPTRR